MANYDCRSTVQYSTAQDGEVMICLIGFIMATQVIRNKTIPIISVINKKVERGELPANCSSWAGCSPPPRTRCACPLWHLVTCHRALQSKKR
jgi:hypothetical protein